MIVMTMIAILFGIALFPYNYYMDRARVEKNIDHLAQEWILAHNDIRNGYLYDSQSHAHFYLHFPLDAEKVDIYMSTGGTSPQQYLRSIPFDKNVGIRSFSGIELWTATGVVYHITPPLAEWLYSTGSAELSLTGIQMTLGYEGAPLETGRARQVLLRPYY